MKLTTTPRRFVERPLLCALLCVFWAEAKGVVTRFDAMHAGVREPRQELGHLVGRSELVSCPLDDQERSAHAQDLGAERLGLAGRMERIPKENDAGGGRRFIASCGDAGGHPTSHGLATNEETLRPETPACAHRRDRRPPGGLENGGRIRHFPPGLRVEEVERDDIDAAPRDASRDVRHERVRSRRPRAMGEEERCVHDAMGRAIRLCARLSERTDVERKGGHGGSLAQVPANTPAVTHRPVGAWEDAVGVVGGLGLL
jgi:hypothetical protein